MVKMNDDKAAMYLVVIVGVVAAVGILVLILGSISSDDSGDMTGQVAANAGSLPKPCVLTQYGGLEPGQTQCGTGCCRSSQRCGGGRCN